MSLYLSPNLDFKANEFIEKLDNDCLERLKTVVAFANTIGGSIYLGVKDQTSVPIGFSKDSINFQVKLFK